jgi:hypothetical protein
MAKCEYCDKRMVAKGLCGMHYQRVKHHADPLHVRAESKYLNVNCRVEGCTSLADDNDMCGKHAQRFRRYGDVNYVTPKEVAVERMRLSQIAARSTSAKSYKKYYGKHEHRIIAEKKLGRKLIKGEIVHHVDGNKHNNSPDNLEIMTQAEHARIHMLERCAKKC